MIIMRIMDIFLAVPGTLLAICIVASLGNSIMNLVIAQAVSSIPSFSRVVRGAVITARDAEYVEAARAIGAKDARIIFKDVLPNSLAPIIVQTTLQVASVILSIAGLSFIGLGIPAPRPEWGAMLSASRAYIRDYSYMCLFPGLAIMTTILSLNLLGDGLRDALDPRLR
jgi:peptide/nickel transport system permease protein